jgi:hypothetical protein
MRRIEHLFVERFRFYGLMMSMKKWKVILRYCKEGKTVKMDLWQKITVLQETIIKEVIRRRKRLKQRRKKQPGKMYV